jgi:hypothetical protein
VGLLLVPRVLSELGVLGPGLDAELAQVSRSLDAARRYGGGEDDPTFQRAEQELAKARDLARAGQRWKARLASRRAAAAAIEAQRSALTTQEMARREAATTAAEIDRRLNELEDLYSQVTREGRPGTEKELLPAMKDARRAGASVLLAIEEGKYSRAVALRPGAIAALETTRTTLRAYRSAGAGAGAGAAR